MSNYQSFRRQVQQRLRDAEERALEAVGLFVEGEAKLRCPVDTGNLRNSIDHKVQDKSVAIGTNVEYAEFVEKGSSKQRSQAYLTPAAEENINRIQQIFERYLGGAMND